MDAGDKRLIVRKVHVTTKIRLAWTMWANGYMTPKTAIRTFFAKEA